MVAGETRHFKETPNVATIETVVPLRTPLGAVEPNINHRRFTLMG